MSPYPLQNIDMATLITVCDNSNEASSFLDNFQLVKSTVSLVH